MVSWNAMILDADNEELCMVYGVGAAELTCDLVNAVNERATVRAENERLRKALQEISEFDSLPEDYKRDCAWDAAGCAKAALATAPEEPQP
jgi:regulator of replication initiation timing